MLEAEEDDDIELLVQEPAAPSHSLLFYKKPLILTVQFVLVLALASLVFVYVERGHQINEMSLEDENEQVVINADKVRQILTKKRDLETQFSYSTLARLKLVSTLSCRLKQDMLDLTWHIGGATDYAIAVLTTVGYGVIVPETVWGKIITFFYIGLGIPIMAFFLYCLIDLLHSGLSKMVEYLNKKISPRHQEEEDSWGLYLVCAGLMSLFLFALLVLATISVSREKKFDHDGTYLIPEWAEGGWTFIDAFYFQVVSLTTVGLGDFHHKSYGMGFALSQFTYIFLPICFFFSVWMAVKKLLYKK